MELSASAKINLGLDILRRRADGYHDIETVMIPVPGLCDTVEVTAAADSRMVSEGLAVDCPSDKNLCMLALKLMQSCYGIGGAHITLHKRIPFGAGLGGGSSDAAAVIVALNDIYGLRLGSAELTAVAARLGSDTAFFIMSEPQLCTSRGEIMTPFKVEHLRKMWVAIVKPPFGVSTPEAYAGVKPQIPETPLAERLRKPVPMWNNVVVNAFEPTVFARHPRLAQIKQTLYDCGAEYASLSGSGSAVYGLFETRPRLNLDDSLFVFTDRLGE